jgi:hypothetical protein
MGLCGSSGCGCIHWSHNRTSLLRSSVVTYAGSGTRISSPVSGFHSGHKYRVDNGRGSAPFPVSQPSSRALCASAGFSLTMRWSLARETCVNSRGLLKALDFCRATASGLNAFGDGEVSIPASLLTHFTAHVPQLARPFVDAHGAAQDTLHIPAGVTFYVPISTVNRAVDLWGPDAMEWKCAPRRASASLAGADRMFATALADGLKACRRPHAPCRPCGATS